MTTRVRLQRDDGTHVEIPVGETVPDDAAGATIYLVHDYGDRDDLDRLIERLQYEQDAYVIHKAPWWTQDIQEAMKQVYQVRQEALELLYKHRARRDAA